MSENRTILPVLISICEAAGCGHVHNRRRWLPNEAAVRRELFAEENRDGGPVNVLKAAFVRRVDHGPADNMELEEGGALRRGHSHTYEIELWRGHVDADDSWNTIQDTYEALADAFETDAVRYQLQAIGYACQPLEAQQMNDAYINAETMVHVVTAQLRLTGVAG